jgi:hypothetical protein
MHAWEVGEHAHSGGEMTRIAILGGLVLALAAPRAGATCAGDCGGDGVVAINELITGVTIALGGSAQCTSIDANHDGNVAINELVGAVANALNGCPFTGSTRRASTSAMARREPSDSRSPPTAAPPAR